ncbi:hypothetical protein, partial [Caballeronia sp.]|uniref:hypothetical protein n=1 Tax=Caballeronia sp. TaxID=1931223 RepID=UPI003C53DD26
MTLLALPKALCHALPPAAMGLGQLGRSVCAPLVLEGGVRLRVKYLGPRYVRAKNLKWATTTLRYSRFERVSLLRFFARLQR